MGSKWTGDTKLVSKKSREEMPCVSTTDLSICTKDFLAQWLLVHHIQSPKTAFGFSAFFWPSFS